MTENTNETATGKAPDPAEILLQTGISVCYATHCRFNVQKACAMRQNEIGVNGQCINFEIRKPEHVRQYLEARGDLSPAEIEEIMDAISKKESDDVPH